jgi:hypothetical protein
MKQKDIALIIIVVFFSGIVSFFISGKLFAVKSNQQQVETVDSISSQFNTPSAAYFNTGSNDPTQLIQIGTSSNPNPFTSTSGQ